MKKKFEYPGEQQKNQLNDSGDQWEEALKFAVQANSSLDRSMHTLFEIQELQNQTASSLGKQDKKLKKAEQAMDETHKDLDEGDKELRKTKSIFGGFVNRFKSDKSKKRPKIDEAPVSSKKGLNSKQEKKEERAKTSSPLFFDSQNPHTQQVNSLSDEMDGKIEIISSTMKKLKKDALDLSDQLDEQNNRLNYLKEDTDFANQREKGSARKVRSL